MKFHIESYGCTMNHGEAELLKRRLQSAGHIITSCDESDINILFSCVVIRETEKRMFKRIRELGDNAKPLMLAGCLVTTFPDRAREIIPNIAMISPHQASSLSINAIERWVQTGELQNGELLKGELRHREVKNVEFHEMYLHEDGIPISEIFDPDIPVETTRSTFIVPISQGCLGNCSYCITKRARGDLHSYTIAQIQEIVRSAVKAGYKEIQLTSQDTGIYGKDIEESLPNLLSSLASLSDIPGDYRMRVGMMNPLQLNKILPDLIQAFHSDRIFKFLHLPVQSGDDAILALMNRNYTVMDFKEIINQFRNAFSEMTLSTDIIVGFPGEDDEAFQKSVQLIQDVKPDLVNITRFSQRPGTGAEKLPNKVHGRISKERSRILSKVRFEISAEINDGYIGRVLRILGTEKGKPGSIICRDDNYHCVVIKDDLPVGRWYEVEVVDATDVYLLGEII